MCSVATTSCVRGSGRGPLLTAKAKGNAALSSGGLALPLCLIATCFTLVWLDHEYGPAPWLPARSKARVADVSGEIRVGVSPLFSKVPAPLMRNVP